MMLTMSVPTPGDDAPRPEPAATPEVEAQELLDRLRSAPAEEIVADLFTTLLSAAQVKLGRRDARLFIDLCAETLHYARPHLSDELTRQVETALGQLRFAQVSAESQGGGLEPNDLAAVPRPPAEQDPAAPGAGPGPTSASAGLWVPGR